MRLPSGIPISFTQHHSNFYTYSQLSSIFEKRFDYYKVFDFIDHYIIDKLFPDTCKVSINIWTGTYEYFYLKLKDEFNGELLYLKVSFKLVNSSNMSSIVPSRIISLSIFELFIQCTFTLFCSSS